MYELRRSSVQALQVCQGFMISLYLKRCAMQVDAKILYRIDYSQCFKLCGCVPAFRVQFSAEISYWISYSIVSLLQDCSNSCSTGISDQSLGLIVLRSMQCSSFD